MVLYNYSQLESYHGKKYIFQTLLPRFQQSFKTQFKAAHKVADVEDELAAYKITKEHLIEDEERDELELKLHFFVVVSLIIS